MKNRYIIVDDFYSNPDQIRQMFSEIPSEDGRGNWAGTTSSVCLFDDNIKQALSHFVGHPVEGNTSVNGCLRYSKKIDTFKQDIHFDPAPGQVWAGVVYLTPDNLVPDLNESGTQFWRHNKTQLEEIPMTPEEGAQYGWNSIDDLRVFLETDGMDRSKWTKTFTVPWRYNRLVLFRPWLFHSPGYPFGDSNENCRVIQTFFLKHREE